MAADVQSALAALIVGACSACAAWALLPRAARRALAAATLGLGLPLRLAAPLRRAAEGPASACASGCETCGRATPSDHAGEARPLRFHPRLRR